MAITCAVHRTTREFVTDCPGDDCDRVPLPRNPDPLRERYSGDLAAPFEAKTDEEIAHTLAVRARLAIPASVRAVLICGLGARPSPDQIAKALDCYLEILKGLA